jgi:hypothetical protein
LLITSHFHHGLAEFPPEYLAHEYYGEDVHRLISCVPQRASARCMRRPTATLKRPTGGS